MMSKFCPDLTSHEEVQAIFIGSGNYTRPVLHECLKHDCVAYANGRCLKYNNNVEKRKEND